jgi:hypothetical protein
MRHKLHAHRKTKLLPVLRVILIAKRFYDKEKSEPPVPQAGLKAPRTLSFFLLMRRSARKKSLSASGFALQAWGYLPGNIC